jgi:inner membrane protein
MILFGHIGITLGVAAVAAQAAKRCKSSENEKESWFAPLARYADIRLLLIGSELPDIIDKPVGHIFFADTFHNGRIFGHTLLFFLVLAVIGLYLYKRHKQVWMLTIAAGVFMHQLLDFMWQTPGTFLWPAYGFRFYRYELEGWIGNIFRSLLDSPITFIFEITGFIIFIWFTVWLISKNRLGDFIRHGKIEQK